MAIDRLLSAYLSRLQACPLFAKCVEQLGRPAKGPGLDDPPTLPVQRIRQQKAWGIGQVFPLMDNDQPLATITTYTHGLRKGPKRLRLAVAAVHKQRPKALRGVLPQRRRDRINPPPLAPPQDVP